MTSHSFEVPTERHSLSTVSHRFGARLVASWRRHRAERLLESLPYDTLKDIGFPSVDTASRDNATR